MSEANKEQAETCARRGLVALEAGDAATAVKLLSKSLRMFDLGEGVRNALQRATDAAEGRGGGAGEGSSSPAAEGGGPNSPSSTRTGSSTNGTAASPGGANAGAGMRFRGTGGGAASTPSTTPQQQQQQPKHRAHQHQPPDPPLRPHTPEMAAIVTRVRTAKTYYELLAVQSTADSDTIARAYKKLALKVHPDKNTAPGSQEAFQRLGAAYAVLTDGNKRAAYDQYGESAVNGSSGGGGGGDREQARARHYRTHFEEEISPEDIFNMFFGGGLNGSAFGGGGSGGMAQFYRDQHGNIRPMRQNQRGGNGGARRQTDDGHGGAGGGGGGEGGGGRGTQLLHFLPLLIFFLFSFLSFGGTDDRFFSLKQNDVFLDQRTTSGKYTVPNLPYYVKPIIGQRIDQDPIFKKNLEEKVQHDIYREWSNGCATEKNKESQLRYRVQHSSGGQREVYKRQLEESIVSKRNCDFLAIHFGEGTVSSTTKATGVGGAGTATKSGTSNSGSGSGGKRKANTAETEEFL